MLNKKALAGTAGAPKVYVEDVFSTFLYTGTGATQTITNNIDLSTEGGLVWTKNRDTAGTNHILCDTGRGITNYINSNNANGQNANGSLTDVLTATTSTGYSLGADATLSAVNVNAKTYVSWTFRKAKKFFDVVKYTGNATAGRAISHNLGSTPGCIIVKRLGSAENWAVWHRGLSAGYWIELNNTGAQTNAASADIFGNGTTYVDPTSTVFTVGSENRVNDVGSDYIAYLFAHDAGGFGDAGSDNVISCGSLTTDGSGNATVTLGYEPQWLLLKQSSTTGNWLMVDTMRGWNVQSSGNIQRLFSNLSNAESAGGSLNPTTTGFKTSSGGLAASTTYIYIAIRRGPMKTPETGTSVFTPTAFSGNDTSGTRSAGLNAFDLLITKRRTAVADWVWMDKLRGLAGDRWLSSDSTQGERVSGGTLDQINTINGQYTQDGINITKTSNYSYIDSSGHDFVWYALKRAPKFFDVVCYQGQQTTNTRVTHNLGVAPELIFAKPRSTTGEWAVYVASEGRSKYLYLHTTAASASVTNIWGTSDPTSTDFGINDAGSGFGFETRLMVAYLFASVSGVSKVGSYTGNGSSQTINCGFTNGARLVLIKRTDSTGDWFIYDTARGIVSGNESQMKLNTDAAQATGFDPIDPDNSGFIVNNDATNFPINVNSATYIYLAIA